MSYNTNQDLPGHLRDHLPEFAQEIYRKTYNSACKEYADPAKYKDFSSLEEVAHHIAWAAVKKEIEKESLRTKSRGLDWAF